MIKLMGRRIVLFLKGIVMGTSDVIPGVSGGTMALVLGIYEKLIQSIKDIDLAWLSKFFLLVREGRHLPNHELKQRFKQLNLHFLLPLFMGILTAILLGSRVIPSLLSNYPSIVRGFFFGLILASIWIPYRQIELSSKTAVVSSILIILIGGGAGYISTDPGRRFLPSKQWVEVRSDGETLETLLYRGGSALPAYKSFWAKQNEPLRKVIKNRNPEKFWQLKTIRKAEKTQTSMNKKDLMEAKSEPYHQLSVPLDVVVKVPRLRLDFTFIAGFLAICAMILPGISGSYILLILGSYFFILNIVKGFVDQLLALNFTGVHSLYLSIFVIGSVTGLAVFSRFLSYFLSNWHSGTMALLTGLMAGCLRGVWPFRVMRNETIINTIPTQLTYGTVVVLCSFILGGLCMIVLFWLSSLEKETTG